MPKVRVTPIIGLPQFNGWSQVVESPPHSSVKAVLSVAIEGNQAGNVGRDIANFFSAQVIQTLEEFHSLLEEVINQAIENEVRILCAAGFFAGDHCAYATFNGAVLLRRSDKIGTILSSGNQLKLITGQVSTQDVVVFSTLPSARFFSEIEIKFTQGYDVDTIVTSVVPGLHAEENSSLSSLAFVTFDDTQSEPVHLNHTAVVSQPIREKSSSQKYSFSKTVQTNSPDISGKDSPQKPTESHAETSSEPFSVQVPQSDSDEGHTTFEEKQMTASISSDTEAVVDSLTASLEEPITQPETKVIDIGEIISKFISKIGAVFALFFSLLSRVGKKVLPIVKKFGSVSISKIRATVTTSEGGASKAASMKTMLVETGSTFKSLLPNRDVYIETSNSKKLRNIRLAVLSISILVVLGVVAFILLSKRTAERESAQSAVAPFVERVKSAEQLAESDPVSARNDVQSVLREVEDLQSQYEADSIGFEIISTERAKIEALYSDISGLDALQELPIFYDLRLVSSDFVASKVLMDGTKLFFFDTEQKTAISLETTSKKAAKQTIPVEAFVDAALLGGNPLVLTDNGIGRAIFTDEGLDYNEVIADGDSNRLATLLATYDPYLYVVNPEKRNIYRYAETEDGFSDPIGWIQEIARGLEFSSISSIAIDGDVWLGTKSGGIYKFTRGRVQDFEIRGLQVPFESTVLVHTSDASDKLYILEAQKNRIVVLQKNGDFIQEISNTSLGSVTDIVVNDSGTSLFAISGSVLFKIDL